jgi:hypothetical protein
MRYGSELDSQLVQLCSPPPHLRGVGHAPVGQVARVRLLLLLAMQIHRADSAGARRIHPRLLLLLLRSVRRAALAGLATHRGVLRRRGGAVASTLQSVEGKQSDVRDSRRTRWFGLFATRSLTRSSIFRHEFLFSREAKNNQKK